MKWLASALATFYQRKATISLKRQEKLLLVQRYNKCVLMYQNKKNRVLREAKVYKAPNLISGETLRKWMEIIAYHLNGGARKRRDRFWNLNVGNPSQIRAIISPVYELVVCMASKWVHLTYKKTLHKHGWWKADTRKGRPQSPTPNSI